MKEIKELKMKTARFEKKGMIFEAVLNEVTGNIAMTLDGKLESEASAWKFRGIWVFQIERYSKIDMKITGGKQNLYLSDPAAEEFHKISLNIHAAIERAEKEIRYADLIEKLPTLVIPETDNDIERYNEIMEEIHYTEWRGNEDEGMIISQQACNGRIRTEARKHCQHVIKIEMTMGLSLDSRKEVTRRATCEKCGMQIVDIVSDPVDHELYWN